jgi:glyoxylase-like metal-dependent hydrolase (beta-lactamase superfamily II)
VSLRVFALTCGWLDSDLALFVAGAAGPICVPVPCYLVDHPRGALVFDTGLHVATQTDPEARLGRRIARAFRVDFAPGEELSGRLGGLGVDPAAVRWLVNSHLHFDHTGGNAQLPNARVVVQRREWEAGADADLRAANAYDPRDYDLGHDVLAVDGEHDVFGDGAVVCIPTHGHTPGHQSLRVRLASGDVVLAADACYLRRTLEALALPPTVHDRDAMRASLLRLRALRAAGARIFYGHDPQFWASVPQAPAPIV